MNIVITHEHHYQADGKGNVFTDNANSTGYKIHKRYLDVFDSVYVIARLQDGITTATEPVTGPGVKFLGLPSYLGLSQFLQRSVQIKSRIRAAVSKQKGRAAFIARTGNMGSLLIKELLKSGHPYGIEVVSDPFDVFAPERYGILYARFSGSGFPGVCASNVTGPVLFPTLPKGRCKKGIRHMSIHLPRITQASSWRRIFMSVRRGDSRADHAGSFLSVLCRSCIKLPMFCSMPSAFAIGRASKFN